MRQSRDEQRPQNARSGCSSEETGDEVELLEAEVIDPEDEVKFLAETRKMLANNDSRLKYVLGGDAIENPFAVDRETQLSYLMSLFCEKKADGGYECIACIEEHNDLDEMHGHLLRHSNSKFYLKNHHCNICGLAFGRLDVVLFHTEREHPTKRAVIDRLRLCLLRAAFDPKGHRLGNAEEGGSDVSSTSS
ncbi:hypothetical protein TcWFU_006835 [Taenia crassiceps]|uniref:C2H2-type domain-containing protein n=1 Tax=Taenia crassiceps TaxID=6207 RepID=A0ABR4Q234_9CEST